MGNKLNDFEKCLQLQGYDFFVIMERLWYDFHDWGVAMEGYRLVRKIRRDSSLRERAARVHKSSAWEHWINPRRKLEMLKYKWN